MNFDAFTFLRPRLWPDAVEILLVAFAIYRFLLFLVGTRAIQIVVGLVILSLGYFVALFAKLEMITYLLGVVFTYGAFAAVVIFAPELRNALARLGQSRFLRAFARGDRQSVAEEITEALDRLSRAGTGAIIAIEGDIELDEFLASGAPLDAAVSADLLTTIFTPYSPLHDGAVLIRRDRIIGAGCVLPLTQHKVTDKSLGTRHRAAIGLSEEADALVLVVSEETSSISVASHGRLSRHLRFARRRRAGPPTGTGVGDPGLSNVPRATAKRTDRRRRDSRGPGAAGLLHVGIDRRGGSQRQRAAVRPVPLSGSGVRGVLAVDVPADPDLRRRPEAEPLPRQSLQYCPGYRSGVVLHERRGRSGLSRARRLGDAASLA